MAFVSMHPASLQLVDFLLPTGIFVQLNCICGNQVGDIKEALWKEAEKLPLFGKLKEIERYTLVFVNRKAEAEECMDESTRMCDLQMYTPLFKVLERKSDNGETALSNQLTLLIGKAQKDFDTRDPEVNDFRFTMLEKSKRAIDERYNADWEAKLMYFAPPDLESDVEPNGTCSALPKDVLGPRGTFFIQVHASTPEQRDQKYKLSVSPRDTPANVITSAQKRVIRATGEKEKPPDEYVLKVCGLEEYLLGNYPLLQYRYIRRALSKHQEAMLSLVPRSSLKLETIFPSEKFVVPTAVYSKGRSQTKLRLSATRDLWEIDEKYKIKIQSATRLNVAKDTSIQLFAGLYHGDELLCNSEGTRPVQAEGSTNAEGHLVWNINEFIEFSIMVMDLPRGARLCLGIYALYGGKSKSKKKKQETEKVPLAWVNQSLFDYKNLLRTGAAVLSCWPFDPEDPTEDNLRPIGTVMLNPNVLDSPSITIQYPEYPEGIPAYPDMAKIYELAGKEMSLHPEESVPKQYANELNSIICRDQLSALDEREKDLVWRMRMHLFDKPSALPKLLNSVKWYLHKDVAVMHSILSAVRPLTPEEALELLDYAYQDPQVREFAVKSVAEFSDTELLQYLLQLCQALKYESHLDCPLGRLLLERAWKNKRIGHFLFWHLRSEIESPEVSLRFGLMLDAYLRGSPNHMADLQKQMEAMTKMKSISELLHSKHYRDRDKKDKAREAMRDLLSVQEYRVTMCDRISTLNPKFRLGDINVAECRFFDSKMRPLLLVFKNPDTSAEHKDIRIIFKNGDDLRQDMLTLQIINIMDNIWQQDGLDLRLLPYGCVATGHKLGFIEVVRKADTIANIQKNHKTARPKLTWDSQVLYHWLKEKNQTEPSLVKAAEAFCLSCAGYSVATYVLGIGDRHSDNIMITEDGQLFHIDFGHFLGNFKVKFGVRRERVPFVLPQDFEIIIEKHFGFEKFTKLCEEAYIILRRKASLFINLLAMMLQTGIPELRSPDDLNYVRDALVLDVQESEAREHFQAKLQEARSNAWSTSWNWYIHGLAKDNRQ